MFQASIRNAARARAESRCSRRIAAPL